MNTQSQTQSIIVYRNPVEQAFWESGMIVPLVGGLGTGFLVFVLLMWVAGKTVRRGFNVPNWAQFTAAAVALVSCIFVFKALML